MSALKPRDYDDDELGDFDDEIDDDEDEFDDDDEINDIYDAPFVGNFEDYDDYDEEENEEEDDESILDSGFYIEDETDDSGY